jgi:hypothetical protein
VHVAELTDLGEGIGEPEPASVEVLPQQRLKPRLEKRCLAARRLGDLLGVHVNGEYLVAEIRHADGVGKAQVTGADDADAQNLSVATHCESSASTCGDYRPLWGSPSLRQLAQAGLAATVNDYVTFIA